MKATFQLTIEGAPDLAAVAFAAYEKSHLESVVTVEVRLTESATGPLVADDLLGKAASLEIAAIDHPRGARYFHGIVDAVERSYEGAKVTLVPRAALLDDGTDHRVFLDQDSVTIAEVLLQEAGIPVSVRVAERPKARAQRVQAFESTLAFVRRILADDGVSCWIDHQDEEELVVIADAISGCDELAGGAQLTFRGGGGLDGDEAVFEAERTHRLSHDGAAVTDYNPESPAVDQVASAGGSRYPLFVFPGHHQTPEEGAKRAQVFAEEARTDALLLRARTTCRHVAVGRIVEITDAPREEINGRYRVLEVSQRGRDYAAAEGKRRYEAEFLAVPEAAPVRPKRERPAGLGGLQTMTVAGPSGKEIHTDAAGRIKARFRWDRRAPADDTSSAWVRPLQPALGGGFFLPRVGWEVLTGFMSEPAATGDTPIELGRLVNGEAPPAEGLPAQKVRSNWGTSSTPGGGKQNQLRFDDAAGSEGMLVAASADLNERTENDKVVTVKADESNVVGGNHLATVTLQQVTTVAGAQSYSVGGNRDLTTTGVLAIAAATEAVSVGGTRAFKVGGDYETKAASLSRIVGAAENVLAIQETNRHVSGASSIAVGGTWAEIGGLSASTGVLGASTLTAGGPLSIKASNVSINATTLTESYGGAYSGTAGGKLTIAAPSVTVKAGGALSVKGADVFFKASGKIDVKAGGVTITITPGSITVKGKLKGDGTSVVTTKEEIG